MVFHILRTSILSIDEGEFVEHNPWMKFESGLHDLQIFACNFPFRNGICLGKCLLVNLSNEEGLNDLQGPDVRV